MDLAQLDSILPQLVDQGLPDGGEFLVGELRPDEKTSAIIALLIWHGFLPMGGQGMLLPKIHKARCVLPPGSIHIGRKVRRRAKDYRLTVDMAWEAVVEGIQAHTYTSHKGDCWLSWDLASRYEAVRNLDSKKRRGACFHSVELWDTGTGELVAGEIGYTCGAIYSSATGFTVKEGHSGAGSVQLAALGRWLERLGFELWDLGMELDYKRELGGQMVNRDVWAERVRALRGRHIELRSPVDDADSTAAALIANSPVANEDEEIHEAPKAGESKKEKKERKKKERAEMKAQENESGEKKVIQQMQNAVEAQGNR